MEFINLLSRPNRSEDFGFDDIGFPDGVRILDNMKVRLLLKSVLKMAPKYPWVWAGAAKFEEALGKIGAARALIDKGCQECPNNEELWLVACRIAADDTNKNLVLRKGLEHIPDSVSLWKAVVELANDEDNARVLLRGAVKRCPSHVELWLALASLEKTYGNAKEVLDKAREWLPNEPSILNAAAKLEEEAAVGNNTDMAVKIIEGGIAVLQFEDQEKKKKEESEGAGSPLAICKAILRKKCKKRGLTETPEGSDFKRMRISNNDTTEEVSDCSEEARRLRLPGLTLSSRRLQPHGLVLAARYEDPWRATAREIWLTDAKEKRLAGNVAAARATLEIACASVHHSEELWLAAFDLEFENRELERARILLAKARERGCVTKRVLMKSAIVERGLGNIDEERELLCEGLRRFPSFHKLWLMLGQLRERLGSLEQATEAYWSGLRHCPNCIPLWLSLSDLKEKISGLVLESRGVLTMSMEHNPDNPELWLATIRLESRHGNKEVAGSLMAAALQECPRSGILWAASIEMTPRREKKTKSLDALKSCSKDPHVVAAVGKLFWNDGKVEKARRWLNSSAIIAPDIGDFWALCYKFELEHGTDENQMDVVKRCVAAKPKHGEKWQAVSKAVENSRQPTEAFLKKVVLAV